MIHFQQMGQIYIPCNLDSLVLYDRFSPALFTSQLSLYNQLIHVNTISHSPETTRALQD